MEKNKGELTKEEELEVLRIRRNLLAFEIELFEESVVDCYFKYFYGRK